MGVLYGYARVSKADQNLAHQVDQLQAASCVRIFTDKASGVLARRPAFDDLMAQAGPGDTIAVVRLDRLGRSLAHLVGLVNDLTQAGIWVRSLTQPIDTTTTEGRAMVGLFAWLSEIERAYLIERTNDGLAAARARGRTGGRPTVITPAKLRAARQLLDAGETMAEAARAVGVGRATLYRHLTPVPQSSGSVSSPA